MIKSAIIIQKKTQAVIDTPAEGHLQNIPY